MKEEHIEKTNIYIYIYIYIDFYIIIGQSIVAYKHSTHLLIYIYINTFVSMAISSHSYIECFVGIFS